MADETKDLLSQVSQELVKVSDKLTTQAETAMKEIKNLGMLSEGTKKTVDELITNQTALSNQVKKQQAQLDEVEQKSVRRGGGGEMPKSIGQQVIEAESLKALGSKLSAGRHHSIPVKATTTSVGLIPTDGGTVVEPMRLPGIDILPKQRLFIRDLISPGRTTSPMITYVQMTNFTNAARVVSEGTVKPYSDITFTTKFTPVTTIAHLFKASKQILDDFAQLQSTIDSEMRYGLKYAEEREVLLGDGSGIHLDGIITQATAFSAEFNPTDQTPIDDIRLAILQSQLARLPANAVVLHFIDWARIELTKDSTGRYIIGQPQGRIGPTLWGLPVVATEVPEMEGQLLTGPFNGGAQIFDREDMNVVISTENVDDFERNLISIRCEERLALAVYRPEGFITGPMTVTT